jgi:hypothetical membrane protein
VNRNRIAIKEGALTTLTAVYEPTKGGFSAYVPDIGDMGDVRDIRIPPGGSRDDIDSQIRQDKRVHDHVMSKRISGEGLASTAVATPIDIHRVDRPFRVKFFTDKIDWLGPAVVALSSLYFATQVFVAWVFRPPYNFFTNAISDLGATGCFQKDYNFCSPRWIYMDLAIGILGAAMFLGSMLIFTEFRFSDEPHERLAAGVGFGLLSLSGVGGLLVACVPENLSGERWGLHGLGPLITIAAGQLGILILGFVLRSIPDWLREFMIFTTLVVLLGGITYKYYSPSSHPLGFGTGAMERLIQYPQALWLVLFGLYISRAHWRNKVTGKQFRFRGGETAPDRPGFAHALRRSATKPPPPQPGGPPTDQPIVSPTDRSAQMA